jgi:hypothetical protein
VEKKFANLRKALKDKGWLLETDQLEPAQALLTQGESSVKDAKSKGKVQMTCAVLDYAFTKRTTHGIFAASSENFSKYSKSILLDNCGATHLVNDKSLLVAGTFRQGQYNIDLLLTNVAVVESFPINIISERSLFQHGLFYHGGDCTLRYGDAESKRVMRNLRWEDNLVYFDYKVGQQDHSEIPQSTAGIYAFPGTSDLSVPLTTHQDHGKTRQRFGISAPGTSEQRHWKHWS